jgi:hypothetical protein
MVCYRTGTGLKEEAIVVAAVQTHLGFRSTLGPWRRGGPRPLAGGRVFVLCLDFFRCLLRRDGEAAATS